MFYNYGVTYMLFSSLDSGISTVTSPSDSERGSIGFVGGSGGGGAF